MQQKKNSIFPLSGFMLGIEALIVFIYFSQLKAEK